MDPQTLQAPTVADVDRIVANADPVLRNLQITQCYHELSTALATRVGPYANWSTFATWASKQAGQSIRGEDLQRTFEDLLRGSAQARADIETMVAVGQEIGGSGENRSLAGAVDALRGALSPRAAFERVSSAISRGNVKVFQEIGRIMAQFLALVPELPSDAGEERLASFLQGLRPGEPPDGQDYLRRAFTSYYQATAETDDKARSELLFLANIDIGFHEQTRLQPQIEEALNAPLYDPAALRRRLTQELFPDPGSRIRFLLGRLAGRAAPLLRARDSLTHEAQETARMAITGHVMVIRLSGDRLVRLGQDLPAQVAPSLRQLENAELQAVLATVDPTPDSAQGSGARDWADLPDRLHFIVDLFRAFHEDRGLFDPPFTPQQTATIKAGRVPPGRL